MFKWVTLGIVGLFGLIVVGSINGLATLDEGVNQKVANVQVEMQAAADKLPNLLEVLKGYTTHENDTLKQVTEARSGLSAVAKLNPKDIANDPELRKQLIEAQNKMDQAMMKMNSVAERYPDLKAQPMFTDMMREVSGTTNSIKQARRVMQASITEFNTQIRVFPRNMVAGMLGYQRKPDFRAEDDAQRMPKLDFGKK